MQARLCGQVTKLLVRLKNAGQQDFTGLERILALFRPADSDVTRL